MNAGDTFLFLDIPQKHLWIVISDPAANPTDPVVIVSLTTHRGNVDETCVLNVGDHPFIKHATSVFYAKAMSWPKGRLEGLARSGRVEIREPLDPEVLGRIRVGASESWRIPEGCRKILISQGLIEG